MVGFDKDGIASLADGLANQGADSFAVLVGRVALLAESIGDGKVGLGVRATVVAGVGIEANGVALEVVGLGALVLGGCS